MPPPQRETAVCFMVEFLGKPVEGHVTRRAVGRGTIRGFAGGEFIVMRVIVTIGAVFGHLFEGQLPLPIEAAGFVASRASCLCMTFVQDKGG